MRDRWSRILFKAILKRDTGCRHPDRGTDDDGWDGMIVPLILIPFSLILVIFRMLMAQWNYSYHYTDDDFQLCGSALTFDKKLVYGVRSKVSSVIKRALTNGAFDNLI